MLNFACIARCLSEGKRGLRYTFVESISENKNLCGMWFLNDTEYQAMNGDTFKIESVNYLSSKKKANELCAAWEKSFKENGKSYFGFCKLDQCNQND